MTEPVEKKQVVEWSFSFENLAGKIGDQLKKVGVGDEQVKHEQFSTGAAGVTSARIELDLPVGRTIVSALETPESLFEADVTYFGEMRFEVKGEGVKDVKLAQTNANVAFVGAIGSSLRDALNGLINKEELKWVIGLSRDIPMALDIEGGVGASQLDLTGIRLTQLKLEVGVGETKLLLPATGAHYNASIEGGVGATQITIAEGATLHLDVEGGIGGMNLTVPAAAAVRIRVKGGLGGAHLPADFKRLEAKGDFMGMSGVWESEGYALSQQQITIEFEGGVGGFKLMRA